MKLRLKLSGHFIERYAIACSLYFSGTSEQDFDASLFLVDLFVDAKLKSFLNGIKNAMAFSLICITNHL